MYAYVCRSIVEQLHTAIETVTQSHTEKQTIALNFRDWNYANRNIE